MSSLYISSKLVVTISGKTNWLARKIKFFFMLLPFKSSDDAAVGNPTLCLQVRYAFILYTISIFVLERLLL